LKAKFFFSLLALLIAFSGCRKREAAREPKADACALLTSEEIAAVQGSPVKETKSSEHSEADFRVSQCYFGVEQSGKSVSLAVTQADPNHPGKRTPKDFWQETLAGHAVDKDGEGDKEEKERESAAPTKIEGVGDDAYWVGNRVGGALYAIKNKTFIRISIGGPDDQKTKIEKSKTLAKKALERL
jgi:hypothetical protein